MKMQSYKTFLINEIQRLTDSNSRSITKWINNSGERGKAAIVAYLLEEDKFLLNSNNDDLRAISLEAIKIKLGKDSRYKKDAERYEEYYANYLNRILYKRKLMNKKINRSALYKACLENNINYGNAFNFFVNKKISYLTEQKASDIILFQMKKN